ncbi:hypothetical protein SAMN05444722_1184 [Rhodovulum sp. ES.010]|uniref:hypothetical protein n=1 Tax=Rhodovulum sp. ES.010 TaxID=1882821 RepID=UPI0009298EF8|nr:hypothetical protein [Rhodovulum sp. ES.010]SIO28158.1 hypothetical protein SAMN05444722_1184 [Rhodovulum sp. ES.010]
MNEFAMGRAAVVNRAAFLSIFQWVAAVFVLVLVSSLQLSAQPADDAFAPGSILPADPLVLDVAEDGRVGFLQGVIVVQSQRRGAYMLKDVMTGETVLEVPVFFKDAGVISVAPNVLPDISADLAAVVFKAGCGRWWKGRKNYWRVCTGRENCAGGSGAQDQGRRWCSQLVSRDACESQGNCPTNSVAQATVLMRDELPLAFLPSPDEDRYCCKLVCTDPLNPGSCSMDCKEVPVGPCEVFTVNCPGTLGEGGCAWD